MLYVLLRGAKSCLEASCLDAGCGARGHHFRGGLRRAGVVDHCDGADGAGAVQLPANGPADAPAGPDRLPGRDRPCLGQRMPLGGLISARGGRRVVITPDPDPVGAMGGPDLADQGIACLVVGASTTSPRSWALASILPGCSAVTRKTISLIPVASAPPMDPPCRVRPASGCCLGYGDPSSKELRLAWRPSPWRMHPKGGHPWQPET